MRMKVDHMPQSYSISFCRTDRLPEHIEPFYEEYINRVRKMDRKYIPDFCRMLSTSKQWNMNNINEKLCEWEKHFGKREGTRRIIELVKRSFSACTSKDEINKLRGLILEAIVAACHGNSDNLKNSQFGWGAVVIVESTNGIDKKEIKYRCPKLKDPTISKSDVIQNGCNNRQTVDFGYWNGKHAKLYECKIRPDGIGCQEINYITTLKNELNNVNISHEVFFVSADSSDNIIINLKKQKIEHLRLIPLGYRELLRMLPA